MKNTKFILILLSFGLHISLQAQYILEDAFPNLSFKRPVEFIQSPTQSDRIFVVEQDGLIQTFLNNASTTTKTVFLDISSKITNPVGQSERGLLGMAFHPDFATNGYFYVNYTRGTNNLETVIARYQVNTGNPNQSNSNSELILLTYSQPFSNHNGGKLLFGADGFLYISSGDGGSAGDPAGNAQNLKSYLGKILRIDVNKQENGLNYAIPDDNPFKNNSQGNKQEIFAYGLRNPWKMNLDTFTGKIWIADVGQDKYDEIDILEKGKNYGWDIMEADQCYEPATSCNQTGLTLPVYTQVLGNVDTGDRSITGGYVYRGELIPALQGKYIFGDWKSRNIYALTYTNGVATRELLLNASADNSRRVSSFGQDSNRELYICLHNYPSAVTKIYKLKSTVTAIEDDPVAQNLQLKVFPNPTDDKARISFNLIKPQITSIELWNVEGKKIKSLFQQKRLDTGEQSWEISINELSTGIYLLHFQLEKSIRTIRIEKK